MFSQLIELLRSDGSIVVNKSLARSIGLEAAVIYSELLSKYSYWLNNNELTNDGYFYSTIEDLEEATGLGRKAQDSAINKLVSLGLIVKKVAKYNTASPKRYFKLNQNVELILSLLENKDARHKNKTSGKQGGGDNSICPKRTNREVQEEQSDMSKRDKSKCPKGATNNTNINNTKEIILNNNIANDNITDLDNIEEARQIDDNDDVVEIELERKLETLGSNIGIKNKADPHEVDQVISKSRELGLPMDKNLAVLLLRCSDSGINAVLSAMEAVSCWAKGKEVRNWTGVLVNAVGKKLKPPPKYALGLFLKNNSYKDKFFKKDKYECIYMT